jgi:hypothetical protein
MMINSEQEAQRAYRESGTTEREQILIRSIMAAVADTLRPLLRRVAEQERELEELRATAKGLNWRGPWKAGESFEKNDIVAHEGGAWIGEAPTSDRPGDGATAWRLMVKAARHGLSAYQVARNNGFSGSEREWLASLRGGGSGIHQQPSGTAEPRR